MPRALWYSVMGGMCLPEGGHCVMDGLQADQTWLLLALQPVVLMSQ